MVMSDEVLWHHQAFDDILSTLEARKVGRRRIADVVTRLLIASPAHPPQSEIAEGRGMALPYKIPADSVSRATAALSAMNLVTQHKSRADRPGRPYTPLQLGSSRWAIVGVKVGHQQRRAVTFNTLVTGLDGIPLKLPGYQSEDQPYIRDISEGDDLVDALGEIIEELCDLPAVRHRAILGVGIELAGHVFEGAVIEASHNMRGVQLGQQLSRRLDRLADRFEDRRITRTHHPLPVIVDNDVNLLAVLESYRPRFPERDLAVVAVFDDGIGSGLITDGRVYRGGGGMAGEIGHCLIPIDDNAVNVIEAASKSSEVFSNCDAASLPGEAALKRLPGFRDPCLCGHPGHLDCVTPVRVLGQLGEADLGALATVARHPAEVQGGLTREGQAFEIAGHALGVALSGLVNLLNPSRILLFLPPDLAQGEPGTVAALYCRVVDVTLRQNAFSNSSAQTKLDIEPLSAEQRRFFGAKAAAVRVLDSFVQHAKGRCKCYVPRPNPVAIVNSLETNSDESVTDEDLVEIS
jgi:predicted NBD/HSP70 family sugar kinase